MPLFLFITGCAMPVAFSRYREQGCLLTLWRVLRRVVLLFLLGMVVQGKLLALFHFAFDILPGTKSLALPLQVVGCNALLAYMLTNTPGTGGRSLWGNLAYPLFQWAENPLLYECLSYGFFWLILYFLYRHGAFLRV